MRVRYAIGCFVVFGAIAVAIAVSAVRDWRDAARENNTFNMFYAAKQWIPALLAAVVAVVAPIVILTRES